ncbi:MAG TPA: extracellular solute-binding protein [Anaerolineales bacterium]|jgi:multiple sugar transport system substrate-binding protein|nr:extracellular solute-binding protein [Anaerolineales bacterium]
MKRNLLIPSVLLILAVMLVACGPGGTPTQEGAQPLAATQLPETQPPATQPPQATQPPAAAQPPEATSPPEQAQRTITLKMILVAPEDRWNFLLDAAKQKYEADHPGTTVEIDAQILPFGDRLTQLRAAATAGTPLDIVSLDQPEVGEFAAAGFTTDLTDRINQDLDGLSDWLPAYQAAPQYQGRWHAIWEWTDARVLWYWKDLVDTAGVDPATDMLTWDGYVQSCQKLNDSLSSQNVQGCLLIGQPWIADWTLPYVWMSGGDIGYDVNTDLASAQGAKESWIPAFDSQAWQDALTFTRQQVDAGIEPFTEHQFGPAFVDRRFATWLGGTWVYGSVQASGADMSNLGLVAAFPVPESGTQTATMAGGWTLAIPSTSEQPDDAWEFLKAMMAPSTLGKMQVEYGYLPTEKSLATELQGDFQDYWNQGGIERWTQLQELAPYAYGRPSFPSWPQVGSAITDMVQNVMFDNMVPADSATSAQQTVLVDVLNWPAGTTVELHDDAGGNCEHADVDRLVSVVTPVQVSTDADGNGSICTHVNLP